MKFVLSTILVLIIASLGYGFYLKNTGDANGEIVIGVSVLIIAFILMPLFIFHRYSNTHNQFGIVKYIEIFMLRNGI